MQDNNAGKATAGMVCGLIDSGAQAFSIFYRRNDRYPDRLMTGRFWLAAAIGNRIRIAVVDPESRQLVSVRSSRDAEPVSRTSTEALQSRTWPVISSLVRQPSNPSLPSNPAPLTASPLPHPRPTPLYTHPSAFILPGWYKFRPSTITFPRIRVCISSKSGALNCCHSVQIASASAPSSAAYLFPARLRSSRSP